MESHSKHPPGPERPSGSRRDVFIISLLGVLAFVVASVVDAHHVIKGWVLAITIAGPAFGVFGLRRWLEVRRILQAQQVIEAKLHQRSASIELQQVLATTANEAVSLDAALQDALDIVCAYTGWQIGHVYCVKAGPPVELTPADIWHVADPVRFAPFQQRTGETKFAPGDGLPGLVYEQRKPVWMERMDWIAGVGRADIATAVGLQAGFAFPVWVGAEIVAVLEFFAERATPINRQLLSVLNYVGTQLGRVVERQRAATALRGSEEKFRALIENATDIVTILDAQGTLRYYSPAAERLLGYTPSELIGKSAFELIHPEDLEQVAQVFAEALGEPGSLRRVLYRCRHKDGSWRTLEGVGRNLLHDPTMAGIVVNVRDVTARERVADELRKLSRAVEQSPVSIVITDRTGSIEYVNPKFCAVTGYDLAEIRGQNPRFLKSGAMSPADYQRLWRTITTGGVWTGELHNKRKNGELYWESAQISPIRDASGQISHFLAVKEDITDRKQAEAALRASEIRYRSLFESMQEGFALCEIICDAAGVPRDYRFLEANPAFEKLLDIPRNHAMGRTVREIFPHIEDCWIEIYGRVALTGTPASFENYLGSLNRHFEVTAFSPRAGQFAAIFTDNTQRKHAEETLAETNRRLSDALAGLKNAEAQVIQQERLRALGTMASGIAHDFNNSLASILGFSELLLHRPENLADREKLRRYLELINIAARDAGNIVSRLRKFYRHREDDEVFLPVDLNQLIAEAISLTRPKWEAEAQTRGVTITIATELAPLPRLLASGTDLREAFTNLIFNAVDALPQGGRIILRTRRDDGHVVAEVSDTGDGMTEDVQRRCLEPFFSTKGEGGTGLGLSMVYGIVQRHAGTIEIQSTPGNTTFRLHLPIPPETKLSAPNVAVTPGALRPLRVLVVDDEPAVRSILTEFLTGDGHTAEVAASGQAALATFPAGKFDVVVVDRAMPGMSGDQLAVALKADAPTVPVIMLTGFGTMMQAAAECPAGVDLIVSKPVTIQQFRNALAQAAARRS